MPAQEGLFCYHCGQQTLHRQNDGPNHLLHFFIGFLTCFVWWIVWALLSFFRDTDFVCSLCGTTYNKKKALAVWEEQQREAAGD